MMKCDNCGKSVEKAWVTHEFSEGGYLECQNCIDKKKIAMKKAVDFLKELMFNSDNEREYLIAQIAMKRYAAMKVDEQRKLLHEAISSRVSFHDENEKANFVIEVMKEAEYPIFD